MSATTNTRTASPTMHKTVVAFAIRHQISIGRYCEGNGARTGYYFITSDRGVCLDRRECKMSVHPTEQSALAMMRKFVRFYRSAASN